jgi:hypothetical protein
MLIASLESPDPTSGLKFEVFFRSSKRLKFNIHHVISAYEKESRAARGYTDSFSSPAVVVSRQEASDKYRPCTRVQMYNTVALN